MNSSFQEIGRNAKRRGAAFEEAILKAAKRYEAEGLLVLRKSDPPVNIVRAPGGVRVIPRKGQFLDFVGVLKFEHRPLFIEAKSTSDRRLPLLTDRGLKQHQWEAIRTWHWSGAVVGVLWLAIDRVVWLNYRHLYDAIAAGRKSVLDEECEPVAYDEARACVDFISVLPGAKSA